VNLNRDFEFTSTQESAARGIQKSVIDGIGRRIVSGDIAPLSFLPTEPELCSEYQVSRTSVREAMRVLATKGLIQIRQKVGTRVQAKDNWNFFDFDILRWHHEEGRGHEVMRDLVELRQILEPAAAKLAASRATIQDQGRLKQALELMEKSVDSNDDFAKADVEFHLAVYAASHNSLMRQFGNVVADFLQRAFSLQQSTVSDPAILLVDALSHAQVYDAINRGEGEEAFQAMLSLVLEAKKSLIQALGVNIETDRKSDG
jgi:DNA-binding FadR family transcriptional regulator